VYPVQARPVAEAANRNPRGEGEPHLRAADGAGRDGGRRHGGEARAELEAGQHERRMAVIMEAAALEGVTDNIVQSMGVLTPPQM